MGNHGGMSYNFLLLHFEKRNIITERLKFFNPDNKTCKCQK